MRIPDVWHRLPIRTINITFTIPAHRRLVAHHITSRIYSRVSVHARTHARTHSLTHLRTHARTHARTYHCTQQGFSRFRKGTHADHTPIFRQISLVRGRPWRVVQPNEKLVRVSCAEVSTGFFSLGGIIVSSCRVLLLFFRRVGYFRVDFFFGTAESNALGFE